MLPKGVPKGRQRTACAEHPQERHACHAAYYHYVLQYIHYTVIMLNI